MNSRVTRSYNRYAFDNEVLPAWFAADEEKNFRPQLPVSRDEVERIKAQFKDIAARPIHKVAEARARKKRRSVKAMETAKARAARGGPGGGRACICVCMCVSHVAACARGRVSHVTACARVCVLHACARGCPRAQTHARAGPPRA